MMITVTGSKSSGVLPMSDNAGSSISVTADMAARKNRIAVNGFTNASASLRASDFRFPCVTTLRPCSALLADTSSGERPPRFAPAQAMTSTKGHVAAYKILSTILRCACSRCARTADAPRRLFNAFTFPVSVL